MAHVQYPVEEGLKHAAVMAPMDQRTIPPLFAAERPAAAATPKPVLFHQPAAAPQVLEPLTPLAAGYALRAIIQGFLVAEVGTGPVPTQPGQSIVRHLSSA